jgi:hypothetical protein
MRRSLTARARWAWIASSFAASKPAEAGAMRVRSSEGAQAAGYEQQRDRKAAGEEEHEK